MKLFPQLNNNKMNKEQIERNNQNRRQFNNILKIAESIISNTTKYQETHPVYLLIKQLVDQELYKNIYSLSTLNEVKVKDFGISDLIPYYNDNSFSNQKHSNGSEENDYLYINNSGEYIKHYDFIESSEVEGEKVTIKLGQDPVLTQPWNVSRLISAYSNIGKGKPYGEWVQESNHKATLWLPFGITFVTSGNHSITTGILNNEGTLEITDIHNANEIFSHIYCDGANYFRTKGNSFYAPVENLSFAMVFEIGRLINRYEFSEKRIQFNNMT